MQLDPYAKPTLEMQYYVQSDYIINYTKDSERDYTPELVSVYREYINSLEMTGKIIEELSLPISQKDFLELISVSVPTEEENVSVIFTISYPDEKELTKIADAVKSLMEQKSSELQKMGSHTLQLIRESQGVVVDTALADRKNTFSNNITTLETQLKGLKSNMSTEQISLFDAEVSKMRGENLGEVEPGFGIVYAILGGILGAFLVCVWIVCKMIFAAKLQLSEEVSSLYGIRLLGEIQTESMKKGFLSGIDGFILGLKNRGKKKISQEQQIKVIATSVSLFCRQQGVDSIYITGSEYEKADKAVLEKLKKEFAGQKIKVQDGGSILYDADSMQAGIENGNIVLVEQKGISNYDEIYAELDLLKECHSNILGAVVL